MIEAALRQNAKEDDDSQNNNEDEIIDDIDLDIEDLEKQINDKDFEEFSEFIDDEIEEDSELFKIE
jgi:hypothetical protein